MDNLDVMASTSTSSSNHIPQWKKDLILRRRNQSKCQQLLPPAQSSDAVGGTGQQPNNSLRNSSSVDRSNCGSSVVAGGGKCNACCSSKMVQERPWIEKQHSYDYTENSSDSDSSEDLHYGPGIVNKLKNRYLSLALRENNAKTRPSILPMRKATSLENLLDTEDVDISKPEQRLFEKRVNGNVENTRYRNPVRSAEIMKRSRSIETISRDNNALLTDTRPKSLHEEMLIEKEGSDSWRNHDNNGIEKKVFSRLNKPKRIAPVMNEKEKPPADVVKQTKKLFEGRPEQRTRPPHATGEVAAKVATYKSIIVQTKVNKKPLIKAKPTQASLNDKIRKPAHAPVRLPTTKTAWGETKKTEESNKLCGLKSTPNSNKVLTSPIPDVSKTAEFDDDKQFGFKNSSLTETPDLIVHSSPTIASPSFRIETTRKFLKEEINNYDKVDCNNKQQLAQQPNDDEQTDGLLNRFVTQESLKNIGKSGHSVTFNFSGKQTSQSETNKNGPISPTSPLNVDITEVDNHHESSRKYPRILQTTENNEVINQNSLRSESVIKSTNPLKPSLTVRELEKNLINTVKTLERPVNKTSVNVSENVNQIHVPKVKKPPRVEEQQNSIVFKFTDRKDVPDYVGNDGRTRTEKISLPKTGEGGIILLPGASLDESFTDDGDEDWLKSLEGPPSPCDVTFINDNVVIDGRSSMNQKSRMRQKMKISFVESIPQIFEYPSEASLLDDASHSTSNGSPVGHNVPSLGGSSLANYTPKSGMSTDDFQLGVTRAVPIATPKSELEKKEEEQSILTEVEEPMLFSAGTNSDILF